MSILLVTAGPAGTSCSGFAGVTGESTVVPDSSPADDCEGTKFVHKFFEIKKTVH